MSHVEVDLSAPLKQLVLQCFTHDYMTLDTTKSYRQIAKEGHHAFLQTFQAMIDNGQNPYDGLALENATMEVFGWRRALVEFEGESLWQDRDGGKSPLESTLMVWNKQCFPHNHPCHIASYSALPTYSDEVPDAYYESRWPKNTGFVRPGSMIQKFWEKVEPADDSLIGTEGVICTPTRTGEVVMFREVGENIISPGQTAIIGPTPYHTLEPVPGYSAVSMNVYLPPMERYTGPRMGGESCRACPEDTYNACSIREIFAMSATVKANRFGHSPATGNDMEALMVPKTVMHEVPAGVLQDTVRFVGKRQTYAQ